MKSVRERFEEIWPVPFGVYWSDDAGEYMPLDGADHWQYSQFQKVRDSYCARLDTFTRCQEMFAASLPERMEMQPYQTVDRGSTNYKAGFNACLKQIMEQKK